jgi:FkbM family methyltransferase
VSQHSIKSFSAALFEKSFYVAFFNIFVYFKRPVNILIRYVFETGAYPQKFSINTPLGLQVVTAFSHHDLITLVECFAKLDYRAPKNISAVVDFGSNIGISALYFLTRNPNVQVYLFEPVPRNIKRLKKNLKGYEKRYKLSECAIGVDEGELDFAYEDTGRYGGLIKDGMSHFANVTSDKVMSVKVLAVNQTLDKILNNHKLVDVVKIDIEGYENIILNCLKAEILACIERIYAETNSDQRLSGFSRERYGGVVRYCRIKNSF